MTLDDVVTMLIAEAALELAASGGEPRLLLWRVAGVRETLVYRAMRAGWVYR